jgi:hypothetical protein
VKKCNVEGCNSNAQDGKLCVKHGAKRKLCSVDGCKNKVQKQGVCVRHFNKKEEEEGSNTAVAALLDAAQGEDVCTKVPELPPKLPRAFI